MAIVVGATVLLAAGTTTHAGRLSIQINTRDGDQFPASLMAECGDFGEPAATG